MSFNTLDYLLLGLFLFLLFKGSREGILGLPVKITALAGGVIVSFLWGDMLFPKVIPAFLPYLPQSLKNQYLPVFFKGVLFLVTAVLIWKAGGSIRRGLRKTPLGIIDSLLGIFYNGVKGVIFLVVLSLILIPLAGVLIKTSLGGEIKDFLSLVQNSLVLNYFFTLVKDGISTFTGIKEAKLWI
ncbi:CvpA family protein [Carboxydothermus hydrogenoformans]|uniref:CvpA family protein n=1 Tax=Carboxydothermus hydrogenoformans (strain ATCC BAA-161 / DSM 6008 / Z-2901) TaxID=246194 RepID=Q3AG40_CARHZ|nr:CvpA family protein [Carboxydothermus hydrogenoformans]ABB16233.1 hypothetical protein CHY_0022 [Carboxydothermus hydrogenoformans Z-2901]